MKLQERDIKIINYIEQYGATIQHIADLFFNGDYYGADRRLLKLQKNKLIKGIMHSTLNRKVYYKKKIPSYHSLASQEVYIKNREIIDSFKKEVKLEKHIVDVLIITKKLNVYVIEVDLWNKTSSDKIEAVKKYIKIKLGKEARIIVLSKSDIEKRAIPILS